MTDIYKYIELIQKRVEGFMACKDYECMDMHLASLIIASENLARLGIKEAVIVKKNLRKLKIKVEKENITLDDAKKKFEHIVKELVFVVKELKEKSL